jgi:hypothetical protein
VPDAVLPSAARFPAPSSAQLCCFILMYPDPPRNRGNRGRQRTPCILCKRACLRPAHGGQKYPVARTACVPPLHLPHRPRAARAQCGGDRQPGSWSNRS